MALTVICAVPGMLLMLTGILMLVRRRRTALAIACTAAGFGLIVMPFLVFSFSSM